MRVRHLSLAAFALAATAFAPLRAHAYYNPTTGRWLNRDPIGEKGGLSEYCLVHNDPGNSFDVRGLYKSAGHHTITRKALDTSAPATTDKCKTRLYTILMRGNMSQDLPVFGGAGDHPRHFTRDKGTDPSIALQNYREYTKRERQNLSSPLAKPSPSKGECYDALLALGRLLHTWQDFFGHAILQDTDGSFSFKAWTQGQGGTPENPGSLVPSIYPDPNQHPALREPVSQDRDPEEFDARQNAATENSAQRLAELLGSWLAGCRCPCEAAEWFYIGAGSGG